MKSLLRTFLIGSGLLLCLAPQFATAQELLDGRVARLERILQNQSGSDLVLLVQRLQTEMQELRGMVEQQRFEIEKLQRQQRDQFIDIDSRLNSSRGTPAVAGTPEASASSAQPLPQGVVDASGGQLALPATAPQIAQPVAPPTPSSPGAVGIPSLPTPETIGGSERDLYSQGFEQLKDRKYEEAKTSFNELLRLYPQGDFADNARYWLGETHYMLRDYPAAMAEYDRLVQLNPSSPKVPGALLKIGLIQYDQRDFDKAKVTLEKVVRDYPNSTESRLAKSRLDRIGRDLP